MTTYKLCGQRFGKLLVVSRASHEIESQWPTKRARWVCLCDCGTECIRSSNELLRLNYTSCGCAKGFKHGHAGSYTYCSWQEMKSRVRYKHRDKYCRYAGRGITIHERWLGENGFINFLADMGERPEGMTLDRINTNGNYEPNNCRWATPTEQTRNTRRNRMVETPRGKMLMADAVKISGLPYATIQYRLNNNWPVEKLFEAPR